MIFTELYQELVNSTEIIRALTANISQDDAQVKPAPETWSILEVICHLYDEEREDFREHLDFILHRQNKEWHEIDPQSWVVSRKYNEQNFIEMQMKFFDERRKSLDWLIDQSGADWDTTYTSEYGSVPAGEMFAAWVAHDNLHIRQLVELKRFHIEKVTQPYAIGYAGDW
ncbi:MAG: DinB family protein [Chloroflexi bacterium]|nr:DinB family protein [Chloroflexota bacterium]